MDGFADPDWLAILAHCETPAMETDVTQLLVEAAPGQSVLIVTHATEEGGLHYVGYVYTHAAIETALRRLKPARRKRKTAKGFGCTKSVAQ